MWALPAIITTTPSPPRPSLPPRPARVQFSHFLHSPPLFRGNRDCALRLFDLSIGRSLAPRWPTTTNDTRVHTRYTGYRDRRKRRRASQGISSSFCSSFIPAFLLDNEHPSYRKERAAYGCQKLLLVRLISLAISPRDTTSPPKLNPSTDNRRFYFAKN